MKIKESSHFIYTKTDAKMISGIALWLMLIHHFWGFPEWLIEGNICIPLLKFGDVNVEQIFAISCKLCVAIFAFNTGYVLYLKKEEYTFKKNFKRIIKFLISYWVIYFFFLILGYLVGEELPTMNKLCLNLLGLNCSHQNYINVPFAWYVSYYVLFILLTPIILHFTSSKNILKDVIFILLWIVFLQICVLSQVYFEDMSVIEALNYLFPTGLVSLSAYMVAKYDLFNVIKSVIGCNILANIFLIIGVFLYRSIIPHLLLELVGHHFIIYHDCFLSMLFIYAIVNLLRYLSTNSNIKKIIYLSGVYSMNMWFLHGIFLLDIRHFNGYLITFNIVY